METAAGANFRETAVSSQEETEVSATEQGKAQKTGSWGGGVCSEIHTEQNEEHLT